MRDLIELFIQEIANGRIEIYNEFSLQHELGIFLRNFLNGQKVQFERNISFFRLPKTEFVKREIDISIFNEDYAKRIAIELKFPRNGQHPEQMFSFCKDIMFLEQLKSSGFEAAYFLVFAEDKNFYEGSGEGIYGFFRSRKLLTGIVKKPTGAKDSEVEINGEYELVWHNIKDTLKYALVEISLANPPYQS